MIYLDNAATTFPKPREVTEEVHRCITTYCGNPGRGSHTLSLRAAEKIYECREELSRFLGVNAPERIVFTLNTTYALNLAICGCLAAGDHVIISELEHNAVRRPLAHLQRSQGVTVEHFPVLGLDEVGVIGALEKRIRPNTRAVICTHASNICSAVLPIQAIGALCKKKRIFFIVDAAQSAGHYPIDMREMHISALAAPGHKSLYGIQGCGFLALGPDFSPRPLVFGGSGVDSLPPEMPAEPPERFEAGTLSTPSIVGLLMGVRYLLGHDLTELAEKKRALYRAARERLASLPHIKVYAPEYEGGVLLFNQIGVPSADLSRYLSGKGICVRGGLHCAPLAHRALQTPQGGAVRVSFSHFNTLSDVDALWRALQ